MDQITSYATLQSAVAGMLHRSGDANITDNVPLFIQLCEADLNDKLLLKDMESDEALTLTLNQNYVALPTGFVSPIAFWLVIDSQRTELEPVLPHQLPYSTSATQPRVYAIDGANVRFNCPAGSAYSAYLRCIKKSNLSTTTTDNYLLLKRPDVYLFGSLEQACLWTADDAGASKWGAMKERSIRALKAAENRARALVPLRTDIGGGRASNILTG